MLRAILLSVFCFLLFLCGCGSGASTSLTGPHTTPDQLTITYSRVAEINGGMHAQWSANQSTHGEIRYGGTSLNHLITETASADSHDVVLTGLQDSTHYFYQFTIHDSRGDTALRGGEFTTPARSLPAPVITALEITNITTSSATVSWRTDVAATTILYYGRTALDDSVISDSLVLLHQVRLTGLTHSTEYMLKPEAEDSAHVRGYGPDSLFSTPSEMMMSFPDTSVTLGDTVRVPIYVSGAQNLAALHLGLSFEPGSVEVIDVEEGPFYSQQQGFIFFHDIRNNSGEAYADMTWNILYQGGQISGTDANGTGIVAFAKLRGLNTGDTHFTFLGDSSFALNAFAVAAGCSLRAGTVWVSQ